MNTAFIHRAHNFVGDGLHSYDNISSGCIRNRQEQSTKQPKTNKCLHCKKFQSRHRSSFIFSTNRSFVGFRSLKKQPTILHYQDKTFWLRPYVMSAECWFGILIQEKISHFYRWTIKPKWRDYNKFIRSLCRPILLLMHFEFRYINRNWIQCKLLPSALISLLFALALLCISHCYIYIYR